MKFRYKNKILKFGDFYFHQNYETYFPVLTVSSIKYSKCFGGSRYNAVTPLNPNVKRQFTVNETVSAATPTFTVSRCLFVFVGKKNNEIFSL